MLTNLWHACSKWHEERLSCHAGFTAVIFFFLISVARAASLVSSRISVYIYIYIYMTAQRLCINYSWHEIILDRDNSVGVGIREKFE